MGSMPLLIGIFLIRNPGLLLGVGSESMSCISSFGVLRVDLPAGVLLEELMVGVL